MTHEGGATPSRDRDSDEDEPVFHNIPESAHASDDAHSISDGNGSDNERVREKLKQTTIAAKPPAAKTDEDMGSDSDSKKRRKRSFNDSDPDDVDGKETTRVRAHERKKSREMTDEDLANMKAGRTLDRVKTPPRVEEEMVSQSADAKVDKKIERKRSRGKIGEEETDPTEKKKISKTEEERRKAGDSSERVIARNSGSKEDKSHTKILASSGFANTAAQSPFAVAAAGSKPLFGTSSSASRGFSSLSGTPASPFGALGTKSSSQSPFGALGATVSKSVFGSGGGGTLLFNTSVKKPVVANPTSAKPFGAPDDASSEEDAKSDADDSDDKNPEPTKTREGFVEQTVMTGEEHEVTVFKNHARVFVYDKDGGQWKERGRGVLKLNKTEQNNDSDPPRKKGARLIMRTEGTFIVVLNIPVYRGMNAGGPQGGPPTGNTVSFMGQEASGKLQQITIRFKTSNLAKELYDYVSDVHEELYGNN